MSPRVRNLLLLLLLASAVLAWADDWRKNQARLHAEDIDDEVRSSAREAMKKKREALWSSRRYDETGFERMAEPRPGEWLHRFPELGQTFDEYKGQCANKRAPGRETILLRPLGPLSPRATAALEPIREFTAAFFQLETRLLHEEPLPDSAFRRERDQYFADALLEHLKKERTDDALILAGIADKDLFASGLPNYVFGLGSFTERVGVYSLTRFTAGAERNEPLFRRRAFQLVAHELGHDLGLPHCTFWKCVMNGANSLVESDSAPTHLCPVCLDKLAWNVGFDRAKRHRDLADVLASEKLDDDAAWEKARAAR